MSKLTFASRNVALAAIFSVVIGTPAYADFGTETTCGEYGTSVVFADSPAEAAKQALKEEKLVFVLHVSGHFEESDYT